MKILHGVVTLLPQLIVRGKVNGNIHFGMVRSNSIGVWKVEKIFLLKKAPLLFNYKIEICTYFFIF